MWYLADLKTKQTSLVSPGGGIPPYIFTRELDSELYYDITSVMNIHTIGKTLGDYCFIRGRIKELLEPEGSFDLLKEEEKEVVAYYCADTDAIIVGYYMGLGLSYDDAINKFIQMRAVDIKSAADCYYKRLSSSDFISIVIRYLGNDQSEVFLDAIRNFASDVRDVARLGTTYQSNSDGIMDYIESTGSYTDGGLKNYTLATGAVLADFVKDLKDTFYYGYIS
jgi:hypothetical protein